METTSYESLLSRLHQFKKVHEAEYRLKSMGIFGSYARREATEQSDLDVFFETDTPNLFTTSRLRIELQEFLGLPIDLVRFRDNMNPRLKAHIMNEGVYV